MFVKNWHIHEDILRQNWLIHLYVDRNVYLVNLVSTGFSFTFAHIYIVCLSVSSQLNDGLIEIQGYLPLKISFKPHRKPFNAFGSINQISTWLNVHYFRGGAYMCVCCWWVNCWKCWKTAWMCYTNTLHTHEQIGRSYRSAHLLPQTIYWVAFIYNERIPQNCSLRYIGMVRPSMYHTYNMVFTECLISKCLT